MTPPIPSKWELITVIEEAYPQAKRAEKQRWTNCEWFFLNYLREKWNWEQENLKFFVKKWFIRCFPVDKFEEEFKILKGELKNIIPNQAFIQHKEDIYVFCSPIHIKCDIFAKDNRKYVLELIKNNINLLRQFKFFVQKFRKLESMWFILDLHWEENLVISDSNNLYYLDSFLVFHDNETIRANSHKNLLFLTWIIEEAEKHYAKSNPKR
ncbi:MAG: hypothetical protein ACD_2C00048G0001 [uncultured bacterium (gcode 4)]|uniref:Uncharacterized protein n=1 Tax=uncultured bacterium (gcode 4) TaxID=1234023 RepID=K2G4A6_9BACT|nr:MAG: hypothetical protein ACD_2C00048G0001 [uncultured bacterium (gcode 4)]